jgi:hypothetical protein
MGNRLGFVRAYKEGRPVQLDNAPVIQTWIGFVFEPSPQKRAWDFNGARDFLSQYRESLPHIEAIFDETVQVQEITRTRQEIIERKVGLNRIRTRNEDETRWLQLSDDRLGSVGKAAFPLQLVGLMDYAIEVSTVDPRWPPCCDIN